VSDRFFDSTVAYQGFAQGSHIGDIMDLIRMVRLQPDLTIVLDVSDATSSRRLKDRGGVTDRYELMGAQFHRTVNRAFRSIAACDADRCVVVSAEAPIDAVHEAVTAVVRDRFMERASTAA
jgi:dTMP kinase